jgi:hypothetical protein
VTRAEIEAKIAANPRFKIVHEPGTGVIIPAAPARDGGEKITPADEGNDRAH